MNKLFHHPFHLVSVSPWPLLISFRIINNLIISINWFNYNSFNISNLNNLIIPISIISTFLCITQWFRDIIRESTFQGSHTINVYKILRFGIILFITSEILFFISFFWAYFHSALSPNIEIGQFWPPTRIIAFNPYDIPLLNTIILVSSGLTITWSHHAIISINIEERKNRLITTIFLGIIFTLFQIYEYNESQFSISDSIYGSTFFIATGFHGIHVIIGTIFLFICLIRIINLQFSNKHHFGFEAAAWYWHFVDVIWLFLYISIYWWRY